MDARLEPIAIKPRRVEDWLPMLSRNEFVRALVFLPLSVGACAATAEKGADTGNPDGMIGNPAPDFHVTAVTGSKEPISLGALHGQVVLLDFWGTFCEPCKKSFPKLEELNRKYAASGLRIIGISEDEEEDKDKIPEFARAYAANFPLAWDDGKSAARRYKPETMPSSFLIDKDGVVRFVHVGYHEGEETEIDGEVRGLLGMK